MTSLFYQRHFMTSLFYKCKITTSYYDVKIKSVSCHDVTMLSTLNHRVIILSMIQHYDVIILSLPFHDVTIPFTKYKTVAKTEQMATPVCLSVCVKSAQKLRVSAHYNNDLYTSIALTELRCYFLHNI